MEMETEFRLLIWEHLNISHKTGLNMNKSYFVKVIVLIIVLSLSSVFADVSYKPKPLFNSPWQADSVYVGIDIAVKDSVNDVIVIRKSSPYFYGIGALHFVVPFHSDSTKFLFHNSKLVYPLETDTVNLGKYPSGTPLIFMYMVIDSNPRMQLYYGKKLFSGQNRNGIDTYISQRYSNRYGHRFAIAGKVDSTKVEVGFEDAGVLLFEGIIFEVKNASLKRN